MSDGTRKEWDSSHPVERSEVWRGEREERGTPVAPRVMSGHEPYTIGAGKQACLVVHGIAGSPAQLRPLANVLAAAGNTVRGVLLPGHGTSPDDLEGLVWQDWYERVYDEYHTLQKKHAEVSLIGFSIGAALSAYYGAHNHVDNLILLNIPLCPLNDRFPTGLMLKVYGTFFKQVKGRPEVMFNADGEPFSYVYDRVPTSTLRTMSELVAIVRRDLRRITAPALIIQSRKDNVSGCKSGPLAYRTVRSARKYLVMLEHSGHSIVTGQEEDMVFNNILHFLNGKT